MGKRRRKVQEQAEQLKQQSRLISLFAQSLFGREITSDFDLDSFEEALKRSVWLHSCAYTLAFALEGIGFRVISKETGQERDDPAAKSLQRLLQKVNPEDTYLDFIEWNIIHMVLAGETYIEKVRNRAKEPAQLWTWNPNNVIPVPDTTGKRRVAAYTFREGGKEKTLPAEDVIAVRIYNPSNPLRGQSAVSPMNVDLKGDEAAARHNKTLLDKGGRIGGVLKPTEGDLVGDSWRQLVESIRIQHEGPNSAGKHMVLPSGIDFTAGSFNLKDMDFQGLRRFAREIAAGGIGVAPMMIGNFDSASYANAEQQLRAFWDYRGRPLLSKVFGGINEHLAPEFDEDLAVSVDLKQIDALVDSLTSRVENNVKLVQGGILTVNEARADVGKQPLQDGDKLLVPLNLDPSGTDDISHPEPTPATSVTVNGPSEPEETAEFVPGQVPGGSFGAPRFRIGEMTAATAIVLQVAEGKIPRDAGIGQLEVLLGMSPEEAEQVMGSAGTETPTTPNPVEKPEGENQPPENDPPPPPGQEDEGDGGEESEEERSAIKTHQRSLARAAQSLQLERAEARMSSRVLTYLNEAQNRFIDRLRTCGGCPNLDFILGNPESEAQQAMKLLIPAFLVTVQDSGELTLSRLGMGKVGPFQWRRKAEAPTNLPPDIIELAEAFNLGNPRILSYLESHFLVNLEDLTKGLLKELEGTLQAGLDAGEGIPELVLRVERLPGLSPERAERIARTETIGAFNLGAQEAFTASRTPRKSWLSTRDEDVRFSHDEIDKQTSAQPIPVTEKFVLSDPERGTTEMMFPADPEGAAWAAVHCRCSMLPEDDVALSYWAEHCKAELLEARVPIPELVTA